MKLCQVIAITNGRKSQSEKVVTEQYHKLQKAELLSGFARRYTPKDDDGEQLPPESKKVQVSVKDAVRVVKESLADLMNLVATQDIANTAASANIVVDGKVLVEKVPVTHLLFLEKKLIDLNTFIDKLPVLDPSEDWEYNGDVGCYVTPTYTTTRTKKVLKNHVKYEATKEHPAQVEVFTEDVNVGTWNVTKFSGAIPVDEKVAMQERVHKLQDAVKAAREQANSLEVDLYDNSKKVLDYVFSG